MNSDALSDCDLHRAGILVTRPAHQAAGLCRLIEAHNGRAVRFPALEILPPEDPVGAALILREAADIVIFISPNAVTWGLRLLDGRLSPGLSIGAVGKATAAALRQAGYRVDLLPAGRFDSEGLLALAELQRLAGRKVVIVRGAGGRALLGDALRERGGDLVYAEVYRRACPNPDPTALLEGWDGNIDLVTATSNDILRNLRRTLGSAGWPRLKQTPLLVISERMAALGREMGFDTIIRADNPSDQVILNRVCEWFGHANGEQTEMKA